jgi:hypothetical protein
MARAHPQFEAVKAMHDPQLTDALLAFLDNCAASGMVPPFVVVGISRNGSVCASRVSPGEGAEVLAEHYEDGSFTSPITVVVLDQHDESARFVIDTEVVQ